MKRTEERAVPAAEAISNYLLEHHAELSATEFESLVRQRTIAIMMARNANYE